MVEIITGTRDTANILQAKKKIDMSNTIALLQPSATPLISLLKQFKQNTKPATNPKFSWMEDDLGARWDAVNNGAGYDDSTTSIVVDNGNYFSVGDVIKVPRTSEVMLVTAVNNSTDTLTVTRGYGVTSAAAIVDNDPIVIIGNANEEGSGKREIKTTKEVEVYNYTQLGA